MTVSDSIDIWFAEISATSFNIEQQTETLLSDSEKARLSATRHPHKRREFLLSRALMRHGLSRKFGLEDSFWCFQQRRNKSPRITNLPRPIFTGLSHSKGVIAFVISESPVGIDLESMDRKRNIDGIAAATMTTEEIIYLNQYPQTKIIRFYELWCSKEAYYKALSLSEQAGIQFSSLPIEHLGRGNNSWHFLLNSFGEFVVAIATRIWPVQISHQVFLTGNNNSLLTNLPGNANTYCRFNQRDKR